MAFSRLRRRLHPRRRKPSTEEFPGYEYGWVLREVAGQARHPNRTIQKRPTSDGKRPSAP